MTNRRIIANTPYTQRIFDSIQDACEEYCISYRKLCKLLETGQTLEDGMTTFDELFDAGKQGISANTVSDSAKTCYERGVRGGRNDFTSKPMAKHG